MATTQLLGQQKPAKLSSVFLERIRISKDTLGSNCLGTALFISGEVKSDDHINVETAYPLYFKRMLRVNTPVPGCLVAWVVDLENRISVEH
jgi:hypothetical protein